MWFDLIWFVRLFCLFLFWFDFVWIVLVWFELIDWLLAWLIVLIDGSMAICGYRYLSCWSCALAPWLPILSMHFFMGLMRFLGDTCLFPSFHQVAADREHTVPLDVALSQEVNLWTQSHVRWFFDVSCIEQVLKMKKHHMEYADEKLSCDWSRGFWGSPGWNFTKVENCDCGVGRYARANSRVAEAWPPWMLMAGIKQKYHDLQLRHMIRYSRPDCWRNT